MGNRKAVMEDISVLQLRRGVAAQVIKARNEQGFTQEELAERTGLQRSNISRLESGNYNPSVELLSRVASGLGMELHIELREMLQ